jgi:hypothetical protein
VPSQWRYHTGPRTPACSQPTWRLPHESLPTRRDVLSNRCAIGPLNSGQAHSAATRLVRGLNLTAVATSSEPRSHPGCNVLVTRSHRTAASQHFSWSAYMRSPPPESNRRPHPYHRCAGGSRRRAAPHVPTHPRRWEVLPTVVSWGVARLRVARFLANLWHAEQRTAAKGQLARARAAGRIRRPRQAEAGCAPRCTALLGTISGRA